MEGGFVLMNMPMYKKRRALLHRVIAKQQSKKEQTHPVRLHVAQKYEKQVKNEQIKRKTCSLCFVNVLMCLNSKKAFSRSFKRISRR